MPILSTSHFPITTMASSSINANNIQSNNNSSNFITATKYSPNPGIGLQMTSTRIQKQPQTIGPGPDKYDTRTRTTEREHLQNQLLSRRYGKTNASSRPRSSHSRRNRNRQLSGGVHHLGAGAATARLYPCREKQLQQQQQQQPTHFNDAIGCDNWTNLPMTPSKKEKVREGHNARHSRSGNKNKNRPSLTVSLSSPSKKQNKDVLPDLWSEVIVKSPTKTTTTVTTTQE